MTAICFVCIMRDAGRHVLDDATDAARRGDQIVIFDDSGDPQALAKLRMQNVPNGVTITPIITATRAETNVAVQIGLEAATTPRAIILAGQARLTDTFDTTRDVSTKGITTGPDEAPDLFQMIIPTSVAGPSILATLWAASKLPQTRAASPFIQQSLPTSDTIAAETEAFIQFHPDAATWVKRHLQGWTERCTLGARIVHAKNTPKPDVAAPLIGGAKPSIYLAGPHANRCPLSYAALSPLWDDFLTFTDHPNTADVMVYTHPKDVENASEIAATSTAMPMLFSEEPFWDSLFSPAPCAETITLPMAHFGMRSMRQINHHTSEVYNFDFIPYYLLTHPRFITAYQRMFRRNEAVSPSDWRSQFAERNIDAAFMAERRTESFHDLSIPAGDITGLCAWRTRLAENAAGEVQRLGASWKGGRTRFQIGDWHRDKLAQLDGQTRLISAIENTHQPTYLSEKLFDAFACAARPIYVASAHHLVKKLGLPTQSWVNLADLNSDEAAVALADLDWGDAFFEAFSEAQNALCKLFHDSGKIAAEHKRLQSAVVLEIQRIAQSR